MAVEADESIKKHLVTASLPNARVAPDACRGNASCCWLKTSLIVNALLLISLMMQRSSNCNDDFGNSTCTESSTALVESSLKQCSEHGYVLVDSISRTGTCKCYACFRGERCSEPDPNCIINLSHGDPTMFESYWQKNGRAATTLILGWHRMSYFAESDSVCWFMEQKLSRAIRSLHSLVGNAVTEGRHIVVGTGSTQLFQAALYALSPPDGSKPMRVVSAAPFYSSYSKETDYLKSEIYRWGGDAFEFKHQRSDSEPYIELVTSPNNPDGSVREAVVGGSGPIVHDLAYFWPHYTPITSAADHEIMLFTVSKSTGHAGTRIGWALVRDEAVARKMTKFIELNTIGVSQDAQLRAAQVLQAVTSSYAGADTSRGFFHQGHALMEERWQKLRATVRLSGQLGLPDFDEAFCNFFGGMKTPHPAFAWLRCNGGGDCEEYLKERGIIVRGGEQFGANQNYVRMSMLDRPHVFNMLVHRLAALQQPPSPNPNPNPNPLP